MRTRFATTLVAIALTVPFAIPGRAQTSINYSTGFEETNGGFTTTGPTSWI